jgi:hypothetical protein
MDMFYKLQDICAAHTRFGSLDAWTIGPKCLDAKVFIPSTLGLIIVLAHVIVVPGFLIWARVAKKEAAGVVFGAAVESAVYVAFGGYGGLVGGVIAGLLIPPIILAITLVILTIVCLYFTIVALSSGTAAAEWKVAGAIEMLIFVGGLVAIAAYAFMVPHSGRNLTGAYDNLLNALSIGLAIAGAFHGFFAAYGRGVQWYVSPILIPLNASWGFIGNILGLFNFLGSWNCWDNHGKLSSTRKWGYVFFSDGMSLKSDANGKFAFTEGAVVSATTADLEKHEMIHVIQHYAWGPLYPISHNIWLVFWAIFIAPFAALKKKMAYLDAVTALSYYDNPWEVMAYEVYGGRDPTKPLIWSKVAGWIVAVPWILAWTVGGIAFFLWRAGVIR